MKIDGADSYLITQRSLSTLTQDRAKAAQSSSPQTLDSDTVQLSNKGHVLQQVNDDVVVIHAGDSGGELPPRDDH